MEIKAETKVIHPQAKNAKDCWQPPETGERHGTDSSSEPSEGTNPANTLISRLLVPRSMTLNISIV